MSDMGRLTTHVLDTALGRPGAGLKIELFRVEGADRQLVKSTRTNADGRCDAPLLQGNELKVGIYELIFHVGDYHRAVGPGLSEPAFLDRVPIRFGIARADQHYHVPLVMSPYGYATYRGS